MTCKICNGTGKLLADVCPLCEGAEEADSDTVEERVRASSASQLTETPCTAVAQFVVQNSLKRRPDLSLDQIYDKERKLGSGATAEVWLVRHRDTGERFAAKFVRIARDLTSDVDSSCRDVVAHAQPKSLRVGMRVWAPASKFVDLSEAAASGVPSNVPLAGLVAYLGSAPDSSAYATHCDLVGIVLDLPWGSHDGSVAGKVFFRAPYYCGAFVSESVVQMVRPSVVELMRGLRHRNLVQLHDWRAPKQCYCLSPDDKETITIDWTHTVYSNGDNYMVLVLDACVGGDLRDNVNVLQKQGRASEQAVAAIMTHVFNAVQYMHDQGTVHHDLKEDNVLLADPLPDSPDDNIESLLDAMETVKICDLDISKFERDIEIHGGTPGYISPELFAALNQAKDWPGDWQRKLARHGINVSVEPQYGKPIDCYALGVMLYRLLSGGDVPVGTINYMDYDDMDEANKDALQALLEPPFFGASFHGISHQARDLVTRLMAPNPKERLTCADALKHPWFKCVELQSSVLAKGNTNSPKMKLHRVSSVDCWTKSKSFHFLCKEIDMLLDGDGPPYVVFSAQLNSLQRNCLRTYCNDKGVPCKTVERADPPGRVLVVWRGDEPAESQVAAGAPQTLAGVVVVPEGIGEGRTFNVQTPDGQMFQFVCPWGQGPGSAVEFAYIPLVATRVAAPLGLDADSAAVARVYAKYRHAEMMASGYAEAHPTLAPPAGAEFLGYRFPAASFAINQPAIVSRSSGEESACAVVEVFLTVFGPWYSVYLGQNPDGTVLTKWVEDHDLRPVQAHT